MRRSPTRAREPDDERDHDPDQRCDITAVLGADRAPGVVWLLLFVLVPLYAMASVAMGGVDPILGFAVPRWNPITWNPGNLVDVARDVVAGGLGPVVVRTIVFVALACLLCGVIGYPVAYFVARRAGRRRGVYLALILLPFWINYLMRMLAWVNLLGTDGLVNRALSAVGIGEVPWLSGKPLVVILGLTYGYIPFFILPLFASLDRIPGSRSRRHGPRRDALRDLPPRDAAAVDRRPARRTRLGHAADVRRLLHDEPAVGFPRYPDARQRDRHLHEPRHRHGR